MQSPHAAHTSCLPAWLAAACPPPQGWSAAALANLMNEAAILTVRRNVPTISLPMVMELVEGLNWGEKAPRIPDSEAKDRCGLGGGGAGDRQAAGGLEALGVGVGHMGAGGAGGGGGMGRGLGYVPHLQIHHLFASALELRSTIKYICVVALGAQAGHGDCRQGGCVRSHPRPGARQGRHHVERPEGPGAQRGVHKWVALRGLGWGRCRPDDKWWG